MAQSIIKLLHLTIGDHLCTWLSTMGIIGKKTDTLIQSCSWAIHTTTPSKSPLTLVQPSLGMNIIFFQEAKINWTLIKKQQCKQMIANNKKNIMDIANTSLRSGILSSWLRNCAKTDKERETHFSYCRPLISTWMTTYVSDMETKTKKFLSATYIHCTKK